MCISIEQLPAELWLTIFSYLEANDLQRAFSNLNSNFTNLLNSPYLRTYMKLTTGTSKITSKSYPMFKREVYEAFYANSQASSDLLIFLRTNSIFPNLLSLSLHIHKEKYYNLLITILHRFLSLQYFTISYSRFNAETILDSLYDRILKLPQLQKCNLQLLRDASNLAVSHPNLPMNNTIKQLDINAWIVSSALCNLIEYMSSLRFLYIYTYHHNIATWNDLLLPDLTQKACIHLVNQHIVLQNLIRVTSNLRYFRIRIEPYYGQFTREFHEKYNLQNSSIDHVHIQMIWKKNKHSNTLELTLPVTVQGQKIQKNKTNYEYEIIEEFFIFTSN